MADNDNLEYKSLINALDGLYPNEKLISRLGVPGDMHRANLLQAITLGNFGIISEEAFGTAAIQHADGTLVIEPEGIATEEVFGYLRVGPVQVWKPSDDYSPAAYVRVDAPLDPREWKREEEEEKITLVLEVVGIESEEEFGVVAVEAIPIPTQEIAVNKIRVEARVGRPTIELGVSPDEEAILLMFLEAAA